MTEAPPTPIRDAVGTALRFVRENLRFVLTVAAIGAVGLTLSTGLAGVSPLLGLPGVIANSGVQTFVYALLTAAALFGVAPARANWAANGLRTWGAMAVIGFFLFIVFFVISIPVMMALFAGPMARYLPELEAAGGNEQAVMAVMTRFAEEDPTSLLLVLLFYAALWLYLTSRLYLAAPATIEARRILTFETWNWTKGAVLRIIGARLMLLIPANILASALAYIAAVLVGLDPLTPNPGAGAAYLFYTFVAAFFRYALYFALEAPLSAALYRGLRPAEAAPATA